MAGADSDGRPTDEDMEEGITLQFPDWAHNVADYIESCGGGVVDISDILEFNPDWITERAKWHRYKRGLVDDGKG